MKAAIFTFCNFRLINYGQVLQCYAFQELCRRQGLEVKVIRYRQLQNNESLELIPPKSGERALYERRFKDKNVEPQDREQVYKFNQFMENYIVTTPVNYTVEEVQEEIKDCQLLIVGSDQLWNPAWFHRIYLLEFAREDQKCISYATGGISCVTEDNKATIELIAKQIDHFKRVSVREHRSADILKQYTGKHITEALDPTLMFDASFWNDICDNKKYDDGYVLCFFIGLIQPHKHLAKEAAKRLGKKRVIYIKFSRSGEQLADNDSFTAATGIGPRELLTLIKNASAICTDSFHGVAFSIIFHKEFYLMDRAYVFTEGTDDLRMKSVMDKVGIGCRTVNSKKDYDSVEAIDYCSVDKKLQSLRDDSLDYLRNAISM